MDFKRRNKEKKKRLKREAEMRNGGRPAWMMTGQYAPKAVGAGSGVVDAPRQTAAELRKASESGTTSGASGSSSSSNKDAAANLRAMLKGGKDETPDSRKRKHEDDDSDSDEEPLDEVREREQIGMLVF